jgi:hypothetical protein
MPQVHRDGGEAPKSAHLTSEGDGLPSAFPPHHRYLMTR